MIIMAGQKKKDVKGKAVPKPKTQPKQTVSHAATEKKDPGIAALLAVVGFLFVQAPAIGYIYLGKVKKGLIYIVITWLSWVLVTGIYFAAMFTGIGAILCLPVFVIPLVFQLYMIWDVYLDAKREKTKLPEFE